MDADRVKRPLLIGVTGNIGSGKSSFCKFLEELGLMVFYADPIARQVLEQAEVLNSLIRRWGPEVAERGLPVSQRIAEQVFGKPEELAFLNTLVHPGTLRRMRDLVDQSSSPVLVFEVPLLFEAGLQDCFDYLVLISASAALRTERLKKRDNESSEQINRRLSSQMPDSDKAPLCDLLIVNEGSISHLRKQALQLKENLPELSFRNVRSFY